MNPAAAFHAAAIAILKANGERATGRHIAEIIGEHASAYSAYVRGEYGIGTEKLMGWLDAWRVTGRPGIVILLSGDGATIGTTG